MRQVDCYLAFSICALVLGVCLLFVVTSYYLPYSKLSSDPKTKAANDSSWPKVGQLITMIAHAFAPASVQVHERRIGNPFVR